MAQSGRFGGPLGVGQRSGTAEADPGGVFAGRRGNGHLVGRHSGPMCESWLCECWADLVRARARWRDDP